MPVTGGDVTHVKTDARTIAHLESIEIANFSTGDEAFVRGNSRYYTLDKDSLLPADGVNIVLAKGTRGGVLPGRWILSASFGLAGATGASGATGPAGPNSLQASGMAASPVLIPGGGPPLPVVLATAVLPPAPYNATYDIASALSASIAPGAGEAIDELLVTITVSINGDPPVNITPPFRQSLLRTVSGLTPLELVSLPASFGANAGDQLTFNLIALRIAGTEPVAIFPATIHVRLFAL